MKNLLKSLPKAADLRSADRARRLVGRDQRHAAIREMIQEAKADPTFPASARLHAVGCFEGVKTARRMGL